MSMLFGFKVGNKSQKRTVRRAYSAMLAPHWFRLFLVPEDENMVKVKPTRGWPWPKLPSMFTARIKTSRRKPVRPTFAEPIRMVQVLNYWQSMSEGYLRWNDRIYGPYDQPEAEPHPLMNPIYHWNYSDFPYFGERLKILRDQ